MLQLKDYGESDEEEEQEKKDEAREFESTLHLSAPATNSIAKTLEVCPAPDVLPLVRTQQRSTIHNNSLRVTLRISFVVRGFVLSRKSFKLNIPLYVLPFNLLKELGMWNGPYTLPFINPLCGFGFKSQGFFMSLITGCERV
jgi:hypothetical protein